MNQITENFVMIRERIAAAAREAGRDPADVRLVAVSKRQPPDKLRAALAAGQRVFGENRVQEAQEHWGELKALYGKGSPPSPPAAGGEPDGVRVGKSDESAGGGEIPPRERGGQGEEIRLHLIGPLQTNKVKEAVALFDCIETVDREKLARKLAEEMAAQGRDLPCFIQVNTGEEPQKAGIIPAALADFLDYCRGECGLNVRGLMCIPPRDEPPALHFAFLKKLAAAHGLPELSMGMSADFEKAIALGATYVRVGTALFGNRE